MWGKNKGQNEAAAWGEFCRSPFHTHIPCCQFPVEAWTAERVRSVMWAMKEGTSPGVRGIPLAVWRALPAYWEEAIARLLARVEETATWPQAVAEAFVAMIPKSSGGSRPQDLRPITVLDLVYRIWAKGVVRSWAPVLQGHLLGDAAMGFRSQSTTLHLGQVLADVIEHQRKRKEGLWLVSFDVAKCFPTLPWWAIFRVMRAEGVPGHIVECFQAFYRAPRQHFRYGRAKGERWAVWNGLAQGCPASPDLLNMLLEPFHRWAAEQGVGVLVGRAMLASLGFADDVALLATTWENAQVLIQGYLRWCALLGVQVNLEKTQVWTNLPRAPAEALVGETVVRIRSSFCMVGLELGEDPRAATARHYVEQWPKALASAERLRALAVQASVTA